MNTIFEKLSDAKFQSLKKSEISNLAAIVGGAAIPTDLPVGDECCCDYSYGANDDSWTKTCNGDKPVSAAGKTILM